MNKLDFVQVPMSALFELEGANLKVYAIIYTGCKLNDNKFYHSYKQFANECNLSARWVKNAVSFLKDNGYIEFESGKGVKSPNTYHIINGEVEFTNNKVKSEPIDNNGEVEFTNNGEVEFTQKEYIKEKDIDNNMDYNSSTGRDTTEHSNNNIGFKKGMYMELNSHSAKPTRVVNIGDTRYSVKDEEDNSSILASIPSSSPSKEKKYIHQITTTEDRKGNTQSNASLHNENEDSSMDCGGMSIDDLEDMFNGGNPTPTQTISKGGSKTTSIAKSNEGGGGQKFTPRKEWDIAMRLAIQHIGNSSDIRNRLTGDDLKIITEGTHDKYRVIDTLKSIQQMLTYRVNFSGYDVWLNNAIDTLEANEEVYTPKQFDYACEIYDDCVDRYEKITNNR